MNKPTYDFIVFGATSFVGKIMCEYLVSRYSDKKDIHWAASGRSKSKLESLKKSLGSKAKDIPLIIADASDDSSLLAMVEMTGVVISTVGPFALYGEPLVKVCAETGTDYLDLTGEPLWVRLMISKYEATAKKSGARIIPCSGFDSVPSDLGVYFLQKHSKLKYGEFCSQVKMGVKEISLNISGGSVSTGINEAKEAGNNDLIQAELANPYSLCPINHGFIEKQRQNNTASYDSDFDCWIAPFVMAGINTRIVHRSNALFENRYGKNFLYDESLLHDNSVFGLLAAKVTEMGMSSFKALSSNNLTRTILENFLVPKPGEGPSPEEQERGLYDFRFLGKTKSGKILKAKVTGDRDPGYGSTAKIIIEAGILISKEISKQDKPGGFWTPATALGEPLIHRLIANAGLTFEII